MNVNYKKTLKLATLVISALLIGTVSANVYYTMFMNATVGVAGNSVKFEEGVDFDVSGGSITDSGQKVTFASMDGLIGSLAQILDPVEINNTDTSAHTIELKLGSWDGNAAPLYYIDVTMYDSSDTKMGNAIHLVPGGTGQVETTGSISMPAGSVWRAQWDIYWTGAATISDHVQVDLELVISS